MHFSVDGGLKALWPDAVLGIVLWKPGAPASSGRLWEDYEQAVQPALYARLQTTELAGMPEIGPSRRAFKAFGIDPGRTRISSESLYRRVRQAKDLYRVNAVVDANNLVSLETGFSLGSYDRAGIRGDAVFRLGLAGEAYEGIGKGAIKLERMPLLADGQGPFGCPVSDSRRTMVGEGARDILTVIYGFSGRQSVERALETACGIFRKYVAGAVEAAYALS